MTFYVEKKDGLMNTIKQCSICGDDHTYDVKREARLHVNFMHAAFCPSDIYTTKSFCPDCFEIT